MSNIQEIIENANDEIVELLEDLPRVNASKIGLDDRSGSVYVDLEDRQIIVRGSTRTLEYYGGFEYIDDEYKTSFAEITIYDGEANRVESALDYYEEMAESEAA